MKKYLNTFFSGASNPSPSGRYQRLRPARRTLAALAAVCVCLTVMAKPPQGLWEDWTKDLKRPSQNDNPRDVSTTDEFINALLSAQVDKALVINLQKDIVLTSADQQNGKIPISFVGTTEGRYFIEINGNGHTISSDGLLNTTMFRFISELINMNLCKIVFFHDVTFDGAKSALKALEFKSFAVIAKRCWFKNFSDCAIWTNQDNDDFEPKIGWFESCIFSDIGKTAVSVIDGGQVELKGCTFVNMQHAIDNERMCRISGCLMQNIADTCIIDDSQNCPDTKPGKGYSTFFSKGFNYLSDPVSEIITLSANDIVSSAPPLIPGTFVPNPNVVPRLPASTLNDYQDVINQDKNDYNKFGRNATTNNLAGAIGRAIAVAYATPPAYTKVYDGTTTIEVSGNVLLNATSGAIQGFDIHSFTMSEPEFTSPKAGTTSWRAALKPNCSQWYPYYPKGVERDGKVTFTNGSITPLAVTFDPPTKATKTYDGNDIVKAIKTEFEVKNRVGNDDVKVKVVKAYYDDEEVGTNKKWIAKLQLDGADKDNYSVDDSLVFNDGVIFELPEIADVSNSYQERDPENGIEWHIECTDKAINGSKTVTVTVTAGLNVSIVLNGAKATKGDNEGEFCLTVEMPTAGTVIDTIMVTYPEGGSTKMPLRITRYAAYDDIISQKFDNLLIADDDALTKYGDVVAYQWYRNDKPIAGATERLYSVGPLASDLLNPKDSYCLGLTRADGSTFMTCAQNPVLRIHKKTLTAYPNPSGIGMITVENGMWKKGDEIQILDSHGNIIYRQNMTHDRQDVPLSLPAGIYIVRVNDKTVKIIVEK